MFTKGLGHFAFLFVLSALSAPAWADGTTATLVLTSDSGDAIFKGQSLTLSTPNATFIDFAFTNAHGLQMQISSATQGIWNVELFALPGENLQPGTYDVPNSSADGARLQAAMLVNSLTGSLGGCAGGISGRFTILDMQRNSSNDLVSLAADFDEYCNGATAGFHGILRYNSTVPMDAPQADAGPDQNVLQEASVALDASGSEAVGDGGSIASYQWTQTSEPHVTLSDTSSATPSFTAPNVDPGGADLVFQLTVTDGNSQTGTDTVTVHVANPADPISELVITSDPGDPAGQGVGDDLTAQVATFAPRNDLDNLLDFTVTASPTHSWTMSFVAPMQAVLQVGNYDQAIRSTVQFPVPPSMLVQSSAHLGACNTLTGDFDVLDIKRDDTGNVTSLAVDFDEYCNGSSAGLHGKLRYNSSVPFDEPFADVGANQQVGEGSTVTLGGGESKAGADGVTVTSYQWTQLSGPRVTLSDATSATPTFTSPDVPLGGENLEFQLTLTNSDGMTSTRTVTVHVANPADPRTIVYAEEDPSNFTGTMQTQTINATDALFKIGGRNNNVLGAAPNDVGLSIAQTFPPYTVTFLSPANKTLQTGQIYTAQGPYTGVASNAPQLSPALNLPVPCGGESLGTFIIRDIQTSAGEVTSFAADFEEKCAAGQPGLFGWVRYNSAVPVNTPIAVAGAPQVSYAGMSVTLDGSHSHIGLGGTMSYAWNQVVATGDPVVAITPGAGGKATFTAPNVPAGGRTLNFQLMVSNGAGITSTDTVAVTVHNEADLKTLFYFQSSPGDPAGLGTSGMLTSADHQMGQPFDFGSFGASMQPIYPATNDWQVTFTESDNTPATGPAKGTFFVDSSTELPPFLLATMSTEDCEGGSRGTYVVRDIHMQSDNGGLFDDLITSLAVDFIQFCDGSADPLIGAYRYNSTASVVEPPAANPASVHTIASAGTVVLDGSGSFPGFGAATYSWKQTAGPAVLLRKGTQAIAQVDIPANLLTPSGTSLQFALTVTNAFGSNTATTKIAAILPNTASLALQSDAGDPVNDGKSSSYAAPMDAMFLFSTGRAVIAKVTGHDGKTWTLQFAPPKMQKLKVGTYTRAMKFTSQGLPIPSMAVSTGKACLMVNGDFTVLDVQYTAAGSIYSLALDFDQTCNGARGALHGKLRYHNSIP